MMNQTKKNELMQIFYKINHKILACIALIY